MNDVVTMCLLSVMLPIFIMALGSNAQSIFDYIINGVNWFGAWRDKFGQE